MVNFHYHPRKSRRTYESDSDEKEEAEENQRELRESIHKWLSPPDLSTNHNIACATHLKRTASWFFSREHLSGMERKKRGFVTLDPWQTCAMFNSTIPDTSHAVLYL